MPRRKPRKAKKKLFLSWSFPPNGWCKLNVDGSRRSGSGSIGGGGVIRNCNGEWLAGFAANFGVGRVIESELWALYRGLELAWKSGWAAVEVESDSRTAIKLLLNPVEVQLNNPLCNVIKSCQALLHNPRWRCSLNFVYREQNSVADSLANFGITLPMGCHYFDVPPPHCRLILVQDLCRVARPRFVSCEELKNQNAPGMNDQKLDEVEEVKEVEELEEVDEVEEVEGVEGVEEADKVGEVEEVTFTWKIDNFSKRNGFKDYSEVFVIDDLKWRIIMYSMGNDSDCLTAYLDVAGPSKLQDGWSRYAQFSLTMVNQVQRTSKKIKKTKDTVHVFNTWESDFGFKFLVPLGWLYDHSTDYFVNDTCIINAKVAVHKAEAKFLEDQKTGISAPVEPSEQEYNRRGPSNVDPVKVPDSLTAHKAPSCEQVPAYQDVPSSGRVCTDPSMVKEQEDLSSTPAGDLMDFRGLGRIKKAYVPLLEEVCLRHPNLIECQLKRSHMFIEWAFTALGRLLHFLKTTKVKDMTEGACEHLKLLWEELETFRFDLTWLEPPVQWGLGMKKLVERAERRKRLREDVNGLEIETKRLRAKLAVVEADLAVSRRDMIDAEEGFDDTDLDTELRLWEGVAFL